MDRLAEQVVAWHNRHPLAKRISIYDVHTIGVVALPFMRSGRSALPIEPVLMEDEGGPTEQASAEVPPPSPPEAPAGRASWWHVLTPVLSRLGLARQADAGWPLFSERFINRLSPRRIADFALRHGHGSPPGAPDWPHRAIPIDEALMARASARAAGAWPYEIYLMSAGIDAGVSRTRVLMAYGAGRQAHMLGRRCLDPLRVGLLALLILGLAGGSWWLRHGGSAATSGEAAAAASAPASGASGTVLPASAPVPTSASAAMPAAEPASIPASAAAEAAASAAPHPAGAESMPAEAAASEPASAPAPDIRPRLVATPARPRPEAAMPAAPTASGPPQASPAPKSSSGAPESLSQQIGRPRGKASSIEKAEKPAGEDKLELGVSAPPPGGKQVALVGPALKSKAEAEAMLERLRGMLGQTVREPGALQAQVFQGPEGWRAAVWPFGSREEAQLINATLIARGMRTKAVDF